MRSVASAIVALLGLSASQAFGSLHHYPQLSVRARHARLHNQRDVVAHSASDIVDAALSSESEIVRRNPIERRQMVSNITSQLETEAQAFGNWMSNFFGSKNATNSTAAVSQVQGELADHQSAVAAYVTSATGKVDASNLYALQSQTQAFKSWGDTWVQNAPFMSKEDSIAQLKTEVTAYKGWMKQWIANVAGTSGGSSVNGGKSGPPPPAPLDLPDSSKECIPEENSEEGSPSPSSHPATRGTALSPDPSPEASKVESDVAHPPLKPAEKKPSTSMLSVATSTPRPVSLGSVPGNSWNSSSPTPSPSSGGSDGLKVAAWWGQTAADGSVGLSDLCSDPDFDIIILAFLNKFFEPNGMPTLNLGPATGTASPAQAAAGATGLFDGSAIVPAIEACQSSGKKVMLSLGGAAASGSAHSGTGAPTSVFSGDLQAQEFAGTLWDLFLGGTGKSDLRPFGDVKLDGIDVDTEAGDTTGYAAFTSALRSKFAEDSSKQYLISAAPQCPLPDQSIPVDAMNQMDYVWVQFYNNGNCNHGAPGFFDSVSAWSKNLAGGSAKLLLAAIASTDQGSGFVDGQTLAGEIEKVKAMNLPNFGGVALWDGALSSQAGDMQAIVKQALDA